MLRLSYNALNHIDGRLGKMSFVHLSFSNIRYRQDSGKEVKNIETTSSIPSVLSFHFCFFVMDPSQQEIKLIHVTVCHSSHTQ